MKFCWVISQRSRGPFSYKTATHLFPIPFQSNLHFKGSQRETCIFSATKNLNINVAIIEDKLLFLIPPLYFIFILPCQRLLTLFFAHLTIFWTMALSGYDPSNRGLHLKVSYKILHTKKDPLLVLSTHVGGIFNCSTHASYKKKHVGASTSTPASALASHHKDFCRIMVK